MDLNKTSDLRRGAIFGLQGFNLNTFGRGLLDEATYQISKTWTFWFQTSFLFFIYICFQLKNLFLAPVTYMCNGLEPFEQGSSKDHSCAENPISDF